MSLKHLLQNFRHYIVSVNGVSSYKQEQSFKFFIAKLFALMSMKEQKDYFFALINNASSRSIEDSLDNSDIIETFKVLVDIWSNINLPGDKEKSLFFNLIPTNWHQELQISHTFNENQLAELIQNMLVTGNHCALLTNVTDIVVILKEGNDFVIYNPSDIDNSYLCNSAMLASSTIFQSLEKYIDNKTQRIGLGCNLYRIEEHI